MKPDNERKVVFHKNKVESTKLFSDTHEVVIIHNDEEYKLRITGNKKLILTK